MSDVDSTDAKFAMLNKQIGKKFYTDGYRPTLDDASVLLGGATMLAGLFQAERDRLQAVLANTTSDWKARAIDAEDEQDRLRVVVEALAPFTDHAEDCAVEVDYPCNCGLDRIYDQLDGSAEATDG